MPPSMLIAWPVMKGPLRRQKGADGSDLLHRAETHRALMHITDGSNALALEKAETENKVRLAIEAGMSTVEAFERFGVM